MKKSFPQRHYHGSYHDDSYWLPMIPGQKIDRYGGWIDGTGFHDRGSYFSDVGVPFENRALPPETLNSAYHQYEVIEAFEAEAGPIARANA